METDLFGKGGEVTFPGILQDYDKFFTPDAADHIILPDRFTKTGTELLEHHVPGIVSIVVVDLLEVVDIDADNPIAIQVGWFPFI